MTILSSAGQNNYENWEETAVLTVSMIFLSPVKADKWSGSGKDPWKKRKVWEIEMFELVLLGGLTREAMEESDHKQEFNNLKDS